MSRISDARRAEILSSSGVINNRLMPLDRFEELLGLPDDEVVSAVTLDGHAPGVGTIRVVTHAMRRETLDDQSPSLAERIAAAKEGDIIIVPSGGLDNLLDSGPYAAHERGRHGQPSDLSRFRALFDSVGIKYEEYQTFDGLQALGGCGHFEFTFDPSGKFVRVWE